MTATFSGLRTVCERAVAEGVVPGLCVTVGRAGQTIFSEAFGARQVIPLRQPATIDTLHDLASLTKALCTSVLTMQLVQDGSLDLDALAWPMLPAFARAPDASDPGYTIRQLLSHSAGLPAHKKFYLDVWPDGSIRPTAGEFAANRSEIIARAAATALERAPGTASTYSDLGFILLGAIIENVTSQNLAQLFERRVASPLGQNSLGYRDHTHAAEPVPGASESETIAATEDCAWRGKMVIGEVHDQNTWAMGGVAGHAGLFGSAPMVTAVTHALCAAFAGNTSGPALVAPEIIRAFWRPAGVPDSTWRLGWDGPARTGSLAGSIISPRAVGHLGYTGCSLWIDPDQATFVVLLNNRVHPVVHIDPRFRALRADINDAALSDCGYRS